MKKKPEKEDKTYYLPICMSIGLSIGMAIGAAIGNISMGMCFGLCIGVCIGSALDAKNRRNEKGDSQENEEPDL